MLRGLQDHGLQERPEGHADPGGRAADPTQQVPTDPSQQVPTDPSQQAPTDAVAAGADRPSQ